MVRRILFALAATLSFAGCSRAPEPASQPETANLVDRETPLREEVDQVAPVRDEVLRRIPR